MGVRGSRATIDYIGRRFGWRGRCSIWGSIRLVLRGRHSTWSPSGSFCVAGAALGAPSQKSAEVRRRLITLGAASVGVAGAAFGAHPARVAWQAQHLEPLQLVLRGRCSTWSPSSSFCMAGAALGAPLGLITLRAASVCAL